MQLLPLRGGPAVLFDAFLSTFDTLAAERRLFSRSSPLGKLAYQLDRRSCLRSTAVLLDTPQHVQYFVSTFDLPPARFHSLPVGCNEDLFSPRPEVAVVPGSVFFYCTYLPLHGVETILRAASLVSDLDVRMRIVGGGMGKASALRLAQALNLSNVQFLPRVPIQALAEEMARAHICLGGPFGLPDKASRVVPGKIYQMLAMGKPIIAAHTPANCSALQGEGAAVLVPRGDPEALASAIRELLHDPWRCRDLAQRARMLFQRHYAEKHITRQLKRIVHGMLSKGVHLTPKAPDPQS